jgi:hypothetical protein
MARAEIATVLVIRRAVLVKGRRHLRLTSRLGGQGSWRNPSNAFCPLRFADQRHHQLSSIQLYKSS